MSVELLLSQPVPTHPSSSSSSDDCPECCCSYSSCQSCKDKGCFCNLNMCACCEGFVCSDCYQADYEYCDECTLRHERVCTYCECTGVDLAKCRVCKCHICPQCIKSKEQGKLCNECSEAQDSTQVTLEPVLKKQKLCK